MIGRNSANSAKIYSRSSKKLLFVRLGMKYYVGEALISRTFLIYLWIAAVVFKTSCLSGWSLAERPKIEVRSTARAAESSLMEMSNIQGQGSQGCGHSHNAEAAQRVGRDTVDSTVIDENEEDELDGETWRLRGQVEELSRELSAAKQALKDKLKSEKLLLEQITRYAEERKNQERNRLDLETQLVQVRAELAELQARPPPEPDLARLELVAVVRAKAHYRAKQVFDTLEQHGILDRLRRGRRLTARVARRSSRKLREAKKKFKPYMKQMKRWSRKLYHSAAQDVRLAIARARPALQYVNVRLRTCLSSSMSRMMRYLPPEQRHRLWNLYQAASARLYEYGQCCGKQLKHARREHSNGPAGTYSIALERVVAFKENARIAAWCFWQADSTSRVVLMSVAWISMVLVWAGVGMTLFLGRIVSKTFRILASTR
ncbi:hypothetical protein F1559_003677 [Cyanidiococcus yangmingshanensis]|uniref:Transmembrane protein n=1 Tax=Cyanidiococcus yangmingshanensis TaxID=2690220 RepID=A0A7J7IM82_9RHOD|nr:hypothetical protein F1559_003677 [Cyanidiococcus yangmingshanensis]